MLIKESMTGSLRVVRCRVLWHIQLGKFLRLILMLDSEVKDFLAIGLLPFQNFCSCLSPFCLYGVFELESNVHILKWVGCWGGLMVGSFAIITSCKMGTIQKWNEIHIHI